MSDPAERRRDYHALGERVAALEEATRSGATEMSRLRVTVHELVSHQTALGVNVEHIVQSIASLDSRFDRMQSSVEAGFRAGEERAERYRASAATEHAALKGAIDAELVPLKAFVYDHRAVDQALDARGNRHRPWFMVIVTSLVTAALTVSGWVIAHLHSGARP